MKKILLVLTFIALMCSCSDDPEIPITPPVPKPPIEKVTFDIALSDITATTAVMKIIPSSNTQIYLYDVLEKSKFEQHHKSDIATYVKNMMADSHWTGKTPAEIVTKISSKGTQTYNYKTLTPATNYIAFAVGLTTEGALATAPLIKEFTTLEMVATLSFKMNILKQEWDNIDFEVIPSNDNEDYYFSLKPTAYCDQLTDEKLLETILADDGFIIGFMSKKGKTTIQRVEGETPYTYYHSDTGYTLCVFGYNLDASVPTTKLTRFKMRTAKPEGNPATSTFNMTVKEIKSRGASANIIPSNPKFMYLWDLMDMERYNAYKSKMKEYVAAYVKDIDIKLLTDEFVCGEQGHIYANILTPKTTYVLWAAYIDEYGVPTANVIVSEPFTTLEGAVSAANVTVTQNKYFNGDDLYALDNTLYASSKGKAYVSFTFKQSDDADMWYGGLFEGDLSNTTETTDDAIIDQLINGFEYSYPTGKLYDCVWDVKHTVIAFARDVNQNYSKVYRKVYTFTQAGASPISEFVAPSTSGVMSSFLKHQTWRRTLAPIHYKANK